MKSRNVLLGLFVGICVCFAGSVSAQKANYRSDKLVEIGPDNLGGRTTSLVIMGNPSQAYAGAASGGLYVYNGSKWEYLPCYIDNKEVTLPISSMLTINESLILIGTGESYYPKANRLNRFAAMGRGMFLFNTSTQTFTSLTRTVPQSTDADFACVNEMDMMRSGATTYIFVATPKGLFRWNMENPEDIMAAPVKVFDGNVDDVKVSQQFNRAFFTTGGRLYKISDVVGASEPVDITSSCEAFGPNAGKITLAMAPTDNSYLYAMVTNKKGLLAGVYLTRNTNSWQLISTSTVIPFSSAANATTCGAITVSHNDPSLVYIAGSDVWRGKGFVENSPYQWSMVSNNENLLNSGDYMASVYSNYAFVHSGIHKIVTDTRTPLTGDEENTDYFIVTDGGVYLGTSSMESFMNINSGLNTVQINSLAVLPDGSLISGANSNGSPFIEARMDHHGGVSESTWYDPNAEQDSTNTNHKANILWYGDGGMVAASRFSQYKPLSRRILFVSGASGAVGRAYNDYSNFNNTQTWTVGEAFMSDLVEGGPKIGQISLWETDGDVAHKDSITFTIDTLAYIYRNGQQHQLHLDFQVKAGDSIVVLDVAHASYPFYHVFDHNFTVRNEMRHKVATPYASRLLAVTTESGYASNTNVSLCWTPTDFRLVFDNSNATRFWAHIYCVNSAMCPHYYVRQAVLSKDGDAAIIVVENDSLNQSFLVRVKGLADIDYSKSVPEVRDIMYYKVENRVTVTDTIMTSDTSYFFPGRISSIAIDPRTGKDNLIVTFDVTDGANVAYIENITSANPVINYRTVGASGSPAYSALIECTAGGAYIGTENGVFFAQNPKATVWNEYGAFDGVPVTAICQQTTAFPVIRYTGHDGVTEEPYLFPHTKWPYAIYFGTYGRGIFMDSTYVVDHVNEIVGQRDILGIPTVTSTGNSTLRFYPNPAEGSTTMQLSIAGAGQATLLVYDINGRLVMTQNLGRLAEGTTEHTVDCSALAKGMYLVNVLVGESTATSKLIVR